MRWVKRSLLVVALLWLAYTISPYVALYGLARDIEAHNAEGLAARVNFRALRVSLSRQVVAAMASVAPARNEAQAADRQLAIGAILAIADPVVAQFLSPSGVLALLDASDAVAAGEPEPEATSTTELRSGLRELSSPDLWRLLGQSRSHGFRSLYVTLPADRPPTEQFRVQLRFDRLRWRLVGLDLPLRLRERLAHELAARIARTERSELTERAEPAPRLKR